MYKILTATRVATIQLSVNYVHYKIQTHKSQTTRDQTCDNCIKEAIPNQK